MAKGIDWWFYSYCSRSFPSTWILIIMLIPPIAPDSFDHQGHDNRQSHQWWLIMIIKIIMIIIKITIFIPIMMIFIPPIVPDQYVPTRHWLHCVPQLTDVLFNQKRNISRLKMITITRGTLRRVRMMTKKTDAIPARLTIMITSTWHSDMITYTLIKSPASSAALNLSSWFWWLWGFWLTPRLLATLSTSISSPWPWSWSPRSKSFYNHECLHFLDCEEFGWLPDFLPPSPPHQSPLSRLWGGKHKSSWNQIQNLQFLFSPEKDGYFSDMYPCGAKAQKFFWEKKKQFYCKPVEHGLTSAGGQEQTHVSVFQSRPWEISQIRLWKFYFSTRKRTPTLEYLLPK